MGGIQCMPIINNKFCVYVQEWYQEKKCKAITDIRLDNKNFKLLIF